jgi:hypothetical protein
VQIKLKRLLAERQLGLVHLMMQAMYNPSEVDGAFSGSRFYIETLLSHTGNHYTSRLPLQFGIFNSHVQCIDHTPDNGFGTVNSSGHDHAEVLGSTLLPTSYYSVPNQSLIYHRHMYLKTTTASSPLFSLCQK